MEVGHAPLINIPVTMETRRGQALEVAASLETPPHQLDCANEFDTSEVRQRVCACTHHRIVFHPCSDLIHLARYYPGEYGGVSAFAEQIELTCTQKNTHTKKQSTGESVATDKRTLIKTSTLTGAGSDNDAHPPSDRVKRQHLQQLEPGGKTTKNKGSEKTDSAKLIKTGRILHKPR